MNSYLSPWHIFTTFEGMPNINIETITPEIYYS